MPADRRVSRARSLRVALAASVWVAVAGPAWAQPAAAVDVAMAAAMDAATRSVRKAFGGEADVTLSAPVLSLAGQAAPIGRAEAEPSSRTAGPVRFVLYAAGEGITPRLGRLTARVDVRAPHLRARQRIPARVRLAPADVELVRDDIGRQVFAVLPTLAALDGAVTRKALLSHEVVSAPALIARALVTSGDEVVTVARVGTVEVRGRAIAAQSGTLGEIVIVVNPDSRKRLRARVVADARVEVILGT